MFTGTITSCSIKRRLLHLTISQDSAEPINLIYHKWGQAVLRSRINFLTNRPEDEQAQRVGLVFAWEWSGSLLWPANYIGKAEVVKTRPLTVDANDAELRAHIPAAWYSVEQLWKCRGGGDVQFWTIDGRLVAIERKTWRDLLSSMGTKEESRSKLTRQLRQVLQADIQYLVIEGRNHKREADGHIAVTDNYKEWQSTGWTSKHVDALIADWQEAGICVVQTDNIDETVEFIVGRYQHFQKRKHPYLDALLSREKT